MPNSGTVIRESYLFLAFKRKLGDGPLKILGATGQVFWIFLILKGDMQENYGL
ncbi:hypothetical protein cpu_13390 [Carboxydothermus pertinax]|uniref:Uncharacterized protein n=1 Tax=Carboxydothermus pertinax TaxID=870242 RepID=A0A1L8CVF2_9THEO|nr:hypothetical protein cpu_13390 [Carboxydothermus pertinax]